jgi:hypothetical protein
MIPPGHIFHLHNIYVLSLQVFITQQSYTKQCQDKPPLNAKQWVIDHHGFNIKWYLVLVVPGGQDAQWRIDGGVGGGSNPPMTGPTKIFSIEFNMVYSVLCVIYAVSLAQ